MVQSYEARELGARPLSKSAEAKLLQLHELNVFDAKTLNNMSNIKIGSLYKLTQNPKGYRVVETGKIYPNIVELLRAADRVVCEVEPKVQFNRRAFNRMGYAEQAAYTKRLEETKTVYYAVVGQSYFVITKTVYDALPQSMKGGSRG